MRRGQLVERLATFDVLGVHLQDARLVGAHLQDANLTAHMDRTRLGSENAGGLDLRDARGLTHDQIEQAFHDKKACLPSYLAEPPSEPES